ncbi:MAG: hypothetical protein ACKPKO_18715, partial [Candidatus Fonsibacter sp.]
MFIIISSIIIIITAATTVIIIIAGAQAKNVGDLGMRCLLFPSSLPPGQRRTTCGYAPVPTLSTTTHTQVTLQPGFVQREKYEPRPESFSGIQAPQVEDAYGQQFSTLRHHGSTVP